MYVALLVWCEPVFEVLEIAVGHPGGESTEPQSGLAYGLHAELLQLRSGAQCEHTNVTNV